MIRRRRWHSLLHSAMTRFALHRVNIVGRDQVPGDGPLIYAVLHRNGALDHAPCTVLDPGALPTLSSQWRRNAPGRLLTDGIEFVREKDRARDGARIANADSYHAARNHLAHGGRLFMFPEGTSDLGPRRLPLRPGIAKLVRETLAGGTPVRVVPVALHYRDPLRWQSDVDVLVGTPLLFEPGSELPTVESVIGLLGGALDAVGINATSEESRTRIEALATLADDGSPADYTRRLKQFESRIPPEIATAFDTLQRRCARLHRLDGVPALRRDGFLVSRMLLLALAPLEIAALLLNLPAAVAGALAARHLPDARNVVAMWRVLFAFPAFVLWQLLMITFLLMQGEAAFALGEIATSLAGIAGFARWRGLLAALRNEIFFPAEVALIRRFREVLHATAS